MINAANNVFGNVFSHNGTSSVYGVVWRFTDTITGDPVKGWPAIAVTSAFVVRRISPVFVTKPESAAFVAKKG